MRTQKLKKKVIKLNYNNDPMSIQYLNESKTTIIGIKSTTDSDILIPSNVTRVNFNSSINQRGRIIFESDSLLSVLENEAFRQSLFSFFDFSKCFKLTILPQWCFRECIFLEYIELPPNLTFIDQGAFDICISLKKIYFPKSLIKTADCIIDHGGIFAGCIKLTNAIFPIDSKFEYLGGLTFWHCISLTDLIIPASVVHIGNKIFGKCEEPRNILILSKKLTVIDGCFLQAINTEFVNIKVTSNEIRTQIIKSTPQLNHGRVTLINMVCTYYYMNNFQLLQLVGVYFNVFLFIN